MDALFAFITEHALYAHWIILGLFLLAGCNIPISEDLLILISGTLASTVVPENSWKLFTAVFCGAYVSDWMVYGWGRTLGPRLWKSRWLRSMITQERVEKMQRYYEKYGFWTLLVGRFIPFGVRNGLFFTAGMGKMPFGRFLLSDGIACLLSNTTLFLLSFYCARSLLLHNLRILNIVLFSLFVVAVIVWICYTRATRKT